MSHDVTSQWPLTPSSWTLLLLMAFYAQFFVGIHSLLSDVHGMKSLASFLDVLTDQIIDRGAPTKLISDSAKVETSNTVCNLLHLWYLFLAK
jgi:hypothetical protein